MVLETQYFQLSKRAFRRISVGCGCLFVCGLMFLNLGCGYMVGGVYSSEVRTVAVPTFSNETYRRGIEFQLTEAVQKEIQNRTPFRLAKEPYADTRLTGKIIDIDKRQLVRTRFDDPRELELSLAVEVTWEDLRTGKIISQEQVPLDPESIKLLADSSFAPEVGHSLATAMQSTVAKMARQIVDMMETPW